MKHALITHACTHTHTQHTHTCIHTHKHTHTTHTRTHTIHLLGVKAGMVGVLGDIFNCVGSNLIPLYSTWYSRSHNQDHMIHTQTLTHIHTQTLTHTNTYTNTERYLLRC